MKTSKLFQFLTLAICAIAFVFVAGCEGPQGPVGPVGPAGVAGVAGPAGADGTDGTDGVSGSAECLTCHSSDAKYLVTQQYEGSGHANGPISAYAQGKKDCQMCHSNEGFIETQWSGEDVVANAYAYPTRISCTTCHGWHNESFDTAAAPDYALRTTAAVDMLMFRAYNLTAQEIDLGDNSNLCANCHQARRSWEGYLTTDDNLGDGTYNQGSTHFGPHSSAQSNTLVGVGGADVGTTDMPTTPHFHGANTTCTTCHMNDQNHEFEPSLDACNSTNCHNGSITSLNEHTRQLAVDTKLKELEDALIAAGLLELVDGKIEQVTDTFDIDHVAALYNYEWVYADHSHGTHNFTLIEALLDKGLEALK